MRRWIAVIVALTVWSGMAVAQERGIDVRQRAPQTAGPRVALVVGMSGYRHVPRLANPRQVGGRQLAGTGVGQSHPCRRSGFPGGQCRSGLQSRQDAPVMLKWLSILIMTLIWPSLLEAANPSGVAVIVGNRTYQAGVPSVDYAHNDADAMFRFVTEVLGYDQSNVLLLKDATKAQMESAFGSERSHKGKVWQRVRDDASDVVVFYSGHGIPDPGDRRGYLLPSDADPNTPAVNGYALDVLLDNLGKVRDERNLPSVTVYLDSCFSGLTPRGALAKKVSAFSTGIERSKVKPDITVVTAAGANQYAHWDEKARHGLFTEHLLKTLYGQAEGVKGPMVTLADLQMVLSRDMSYAARSVSGREQNAEVIGVPTTALVSWPGGRPPKRSGGAVSSAGVRLTAHCQSDGRIHGEFPLDSRARFFLTEEQRPFLEFEKIMRDRSYRASDFRAWRWGEKTMFPLVSRVVALNEDFWVGPAGIGLALSYNPCTGVLSVMSADLPQRAVFYNSED